MKKKFAVIGYGGQGAWHCNQILKSDVAELTGTYDIREVRNNLARSNGIYVYDSIDSILSDKNVDAVVIAVPNDIHKELVIRCSNAKKHVICEKPVEMSAKAYDEMVDAANRNNVLFTVHQNRRWDVDYLAMKKLCTSLEIGTPISIETRVQGSRGIPTDWRSQKQYGGGMILDWGVHLIDQVLQLFKAKIIRLFCTFSHITNKEVDDGFKLNLYFEDGKSAYIEVGTYNFIAMPRFYLQCSQGTAIIEEWTKNTKVAKMKAWNEKDVLPVTTSSGITKTMAPRDEITLDTYELERPVSDVHDFYRNFCKALDGKEKLLITHEEVRRVLEVMEYSFLSVEKNQVIEVNI